MIVRFSGEIGIKSDWTRRSYERLIRKNIEKALAYHDLRYMEMISKRGRIYIRGKNVHDIASDLTRVFGISSTSPATTIRSIMADIVQASLEMAKANVKDGTSFAVRCHRVGNHNYSSVDICREVGKEILTRLEDKNLKVNLSNPESTISIEIRDDDAYVYTETLQGVGGFPAGSQGKVVCLLSGGIDSPVASWLAMKRGCPIIPIYLDNVPLTDETTTRKALETAKRLFEWSIGCPRKMYVVPNGRNLQTFMEMAPRRFTCLLCKRLMYRIAGRVAKIEDADGIVTGEAIGEQASQTLTNLRVLDEAAVDYPIHRPLLGFDKTETEALARKIGTFEASTRKAKGCCAAPSQPATKARLEMVKNAEERLDIEKMVRESVERANVIVL